MGSFEARKTQCLEASHPRRPFWLDSQSHGAEGRVSPACDIDRPELSSGRVRRLKDLLPSGLESSCPPRRTLHPPIKIIGPRYLSALGFSSPPYAGRKAKNWPVGR